MLPRKHLAFSVADQNSANPTGPVANLSPFSSAIRPHKEAYSMIYLSLCPAPLLVRLFLYVASWLLWLRCLVHPSLYLQPPPTEISPSSTKENLRISMVSLLR